MISIPAAASARGATRARTRPPEARERSGRTRRARSGDADLSAGDWSRGDMAERAAARFSAAAPEVGTAARLNGRTARRARLAGSAGAAAPTVLRAACFTALCPWPGLLPPPGSPALARELRLAPSLALPRAVCAARLVAGLDAMARLAAFLAPPLGARLGLAPPRFPAALAEPFAFLELFFWPLFFPVLRAVLFAIITTVATVRHGKPAPE